MGKDQALFIVPEEGGKLAQKYLVRHEPREEKP